LPNKGRRGGGEEREKKGRKGGEEESELRRIGRASNQSSSEIGIRTTMEVV